MDGIDWYYLRKMIERNKKPWRYFKYYRSKAGFTDSISICDFTLPKRATHVQTGHAADDWYRDSFVCNAGYFNGTIPLRDNPSVYDYALNKWVEKPARGAINTVETLVSHGCVERTREVDEFIRTGYWSPHV